MGSPLWVVGVSNVPGLLLSAIRGHQQRSQRRGSAMAKSPKPPASGNVSKLHESLIPDRHVSSTMADRYRAHLGQVRPVSGVSRRQETLLLCRTMRDDLFSLDDLIDTTRRSYAKVRGIPESDPCFSALTDRRQRLANEIELCDTIQSQFPRPPSRSPRLSQEEHAALDDPDTDPHDVRESELADYIQEQATSIDSAGSAYAGHDYEFDKYIENIVEAAGRLGRILKSKE